MIYSYYFNSFLGSLAEGLIQYSIAPTIAHLRKMLSVTLSALILNVVLADLGILFFINCQNFDAVDQVFQGVDKQ